MPLATLRRSDDRVVAGVCAGIAEAIGVDPTLVRLVFTLLALAGGAGIALYGAVWLYMNGKGWLAVVALVAASGFGLRGLGLSAQTAAALVLIACGLAVIWYRAGSLRPGTSLSVVGLGLVGIGAALLLFRGSTSFLAPGAVAARSC
jgi:phage shock protein PspC (stress-responsive transcriptional regulator)